MSSTKVFWIDSNYDDDFNKETYDLLSSKSQYFELKPFKNFDEAFDQMQKLDLEVILVIIRGRLYQEYYERLKELRSKLKCIPINIIYTSVRLRKVLQRKVIDERKELKEETVESIGDDYYNKGGIAVVPNELLKSIENILGIESSPKPEEPIFHFEVINDNYENLILPCLYTKVLSRDSIIDNFDINQFNTKLNMDHRDNELCKTINDFIKVGKIPIKNAAQFWIKYYTKNDTFYKVMNKEFAENDFSHYGIFIKALNLGLEQKFLKSVVDKYLYYSSPISKDDFENLNRNLSNKKKELIYSRQLLSFSQDKEVSLDFIKESTDKNYIQVLFEVNISHFSETYTNNVDFDEFSYYPGNKDVTFLPYSIFVIEDQIEEKKKGGIPYKLIKLNYLGNYSQQLNNIINTLDKKKIENLLENKSYKFSKDIKEKFRNEFPDLEVFDLVKLLNIEAQLIQDKNKQKENYQYPTNIIEIIMKKKGKFIGDDFYQRYHWMLDVYFDDILQNEINSNEIKSIIPNKIKIEIKYPIYDCEKMFCLCEDIKEINFIKFDTSRVTNMNGMFSDCTSLMKLNVDVFDTSNIVNMSCMFYKCSSLKDLDLSKFKTDNVEDMSAMFYLCTSLENLNFDLSKMKTDKLKDISFMFRGSSHSLKNYDLSNFKNLIKIPNKDGYI